MIKKVDILICAFNESIFNVEKILLEPQDWVHYIISHQVTNQTYFVPEFLKNRKDVTIYRTIGKGISKNRNNILNKSSADICFIADDDVRYNLSEIQSVIDVFNEDENLDIFVGKIRTYDGEPEYKEYDNFSHKINYFNASKVSSIEIVFKNEVLIKKKIQFDENFGLHGNKYKHGGEELIFITDCLKHGLKVVFYPIYMVKHTYESSGKNKNGGVDLFLYHWALSRRIFIYPLAFLAIIRKYIKNYQLYNISLCKAIKTIFYN